VAQAAGGFWVEGAVEAGFGMISVTTFSEAGGHPVNEDAFTVQRHPADLNCWICCIADGQGGRAGGRQAAQLACRTAVESAISTSPAKLSNPFTWTSLLRKADQTVRDDTEAGFTTLIGFCVGPGDLAGASCGDSAVALFDCNQRLHDVTANQLKNPPVGSGTAPFQPFGTLLSATWRVLAMIDGVWKYMGWDRISEAISATPGESLVLRLQDVVRSRNGGKFPDDFTVVSFDGTNGD
jgi:hypothetical protein